MLGAWQRMGCWFLVSIGSSRAERDVLQELEADQGQALIQRRSIGSEALDTSEELYSGIREAAQADSDPCSPHGPVWAADADGHSCGSRIAWINGQLHKPMEAARKQIAKEFPGQCGMCACWMTMANGHTCGARIRYIQDHTKHKTLPAASAAVAAEFPVECGSCVGGRAPSRPPVDAPVHRPTSSLKVGVGFSLHYMKRKLDPKVAAKKLAGIGISTVRMWSYRPAVLQGLLEAGIHDVLVNVPNEELDWLAWDPSHSKAVAGILKPFHQQGMKFRVGVGNEPLASWENRDNNGKKLAPAMERMLEALKKQGMRDVTVTVPFFAGVMGHTYPPTEGSFHSKHVATVKAAAAVIHRSGGEFTIHQYPWFARKGDPGNVPLDLAVGRRGSNVHGRQYTGLLHQQLAAVRAALVRLDGRYKSMPVTVGESGWPSAGHPEATLQNACDYARNSIHAATRTDNPMDPHLRTFYLFEAFDEQKKAQVAHGGSSRETENNFGIFYENGTPKCPGLTFR
eukprot:CAMPEP_0204569052 /NCGR_PEP_ID=MMETSP0661-20131031/37521_1 /ASSEMBLY_ACC=CAM_ASM_000606 /TAXON_ID=109239 /ORGANISM="Alexandrium margalefi, Strain AMGDE01CS-322" /LENGTH=511 /DNA_ID=CAMNT_0051577121 /DNA_START=87 /DNA_END=1622 /DNA_ORIENTATION=+